MTVARDQVKAACDKAGVAFLEIVKPETVAAQIDAGVRVGAATEAAARAGRAHQDGGAS
jgi:hypothetical protein